MVRGVLAVYLLFSPHSARGTEGTLNKPHTKWVLEHVLAIGSLDIDMVEVLQGNLLQVHVFNSLKIINSIQLLFLYLLSILFICISFLIV
jgi:hypothetical protein